MPMKFSSKVALCLIGQSSGLEILQRKRRAKGTMFPGGGMPGAGGGAAGGMAGVMGCETKVQKENCLASADCGWKYRNDDPFAKECVPWQMTGQSSCAAWAGTVQAPWIGECSGGGAVAAAAPAAPAPAAPAAPVAPAPAAPGAAVAPAPAPTPCPACPACPPPAPCPACPTLPPPPTFYAGSTGDKVTHRPVEVKFPKPVPNGVVLLGALSFDGGHPAVAMLTDQTEGGFVCRVQEPAECNYDDKHTTEELDWLTDSMGLHQTDEGVPYIIGVAELDVTQKWNNIDFPKDLFQNDAVVVILTPQEQVAQNEFMTLRIDGTTKDGFQFLYQVPKRKGGAEHSVPEKIGYLAIPVGEGSINGKPYIAGNSQRKVKQSWHTVNLGEKVSNPLVFGQILTYHGTDASTLRMKRVKGDTSKLTFRVHETTGKCGYRPAHTTEEVGYFVLSN